MRIYKYIYTVEPILTQGWGKFVGTSRLPLDEIRRRRNMFRTKRNFLGRRGSKAKFFITKWGFVWSFPGTVEVNELCPPSMKERIAIPVYATEKPGITTKFSNLWTRDYPYDLVQVKFNYAPFNVRRKRWKRWSVKAFDTLARRNGYEVIR